MAQGWLYDGVSAVRRGAEVEPGPDGTIRILADGLAADEVPADALTHIESRPGLDTYGRTGQPGWRLSLAAPVAPEIAARLPGRRVYGRWVDRIGLWRAVAIGVVASALVLTGGYFAPHLLAPLVPTGLERRYGDMLVGDFGGKFCNGPGGQAALDKLARTLDPQSADLKLRVVNIKLVNAAALPGGNIVIFRELLQEADGPDEVAGIVAHEIGHVRQRHVTEGLIRHLGFDLMIAAFGGNTGANATTLLSLRYGRGAEREADAEAIAALSRAYISPRGTAAFFGRISQQERKLGRVAGTLAYVSTHPVSGERQRLFAGSAEAGRTYRPALSEEEWSALSAICHNDPAQRGKAGYTLW